MPTYLSPNHSALDPGGVITSAFDMGADFPGPAEDILMSWLLRLPGEDEAAKAAGELLALNRSRLDGIAPDAPIFRLVQLLEQTAASIKSAPKRRGGRSGRLAKED